MLGYAKALIAAALAGLASAQAALPDGITQAEWVAIAIATLSGLGIVAAVPNRPPTPAVAFEDIDAVPGDDQ